MAKHYEQETQYKNTNRSLVCYSQKYLNISEDKIDTSNLQKSKRIMVKLQMEKF